MDIIITILEYIKAVLLLTFGQLISILGIFFFFGLILYLLARFTRTTFVKSIGYNFDVYVTGWIGTPIHELGHALFCLPFGHKIVEMKLFRPNAGDGSLGYVNHSYNPNNLWHRMGNFFIGFGPILFGSVVLYFLIKYMVPNNNHLLNLINSQQANLTSFSGLIDQFKLLFNTGTNMFSALFTSANMHTWQFWVFIYVSLCISSHMELSPPDLKGVWSGLLSIIFLFIIINSISVFFGVDLSKFTSVISSYSYMTAGIFTFATFISCLFFVSAYLILNIYTLIRYRKAFSPIA